METRQDAGSIPAASTYKKMAKKKAYKSHKIDEKELEEIRVHNSIIDDKEKLLKIKHQEMWKKKKKERLGFNG